MVMIDMEIALGLDHDVDARMARKQVKHMVEESNAGCDRCTACPIEIDFDLDIGLLSLALHGTFAHAYILYSRAFYQGFAGFATAAAAVCKYFALCLDDANRKALGICHRTNFHPGTARLSLRSEKAAAWSSAATGRCRLARRSSN